MKEGDTVRFSRIYPPSPRPQHKDKIGLLVEHDKLMGTVTVLHEGELIKLRSSQCEKAGKRDLDKSR